MIIILLIVKTTLIVKTDSKITSFWSSFLFNSWFYSLNLVWFNYYLAHACNWSSGQAIWHRSSSGRFPYVTSPCKKSLPTSTHYMPNEYKTKTKGIPTSYKRISKYTNIFLNIISNINIRISICITLFCIYIYNYLYNHNYNYNYKYT